MVKPDRSIWSGKLGFILAASGSAVGLGNIWKFPYITGSNGGGAFVCIYLLCVLLISWPALIAELYIGQQGQCNPKAAFERLKGKQTPWRAVGLLSVCCAFIILSFYSVIGGWVLDFEIRSILNEFQMRSDSEIKLTLSTLFQNPGRQVLFLFLFLCLSGAMIMTGVQKGVERWNCILMPSLFIVLLGLFFYSTTLPGFFKALTFLFSFDVESLGASAILDAMGLAFFTLSVGCGVMLTYGSYLSRSAYLPSVTIPVVFVDTVIALLFGVVIFSTVFSFHGVEVSVGPTLIFQTLPLLFSKMYGGYYIAILFFMLVVFAALTSTISVYEVVISFVEETYSMSRRKSTILIGLGAFFLGLLSAFSSNILSHITLFGLNFLDFFDKLTSSFMLPITGLLIVVFYAWVLGYRALEKSLYKASSLQLKVFYLCTKYVTPMAILIVFFMVAT